MKGLNGDREGVRGPERGLRYHMWGGGGGERGGWEGNVPDRLQRGIRAVSAHWFCALLYCTGDCSWVLFSQRD